MNDIEDQIIEIVKSVVDPNIEINPEYIINALGELDSLSLARLVFSLEEKFEKNLSLNFFMQPRTIKEVASIVSSNER